MARGNAVIFLSGRLLSLVLLMGFQLLVVRILAPVEYGRFAIVFAFAVLMQTVLSFGVPRLIPKYVGQAGWTLAPRTVRKLVALIVAFRLGASLAAIAAGLAAAQIFGWLAPHDGLYLLAAIAYILVSVVQTDADSMALALGLQHLSRNALVGEAAARLALVSGAAVAGMAGTASTLLWIGTATTLIAVVTLLARVLTTIAAMPAEAEQPQPLDRAEFRAIALSGYASALAWFASSPATIRLIASRYLAVVTFAGFSFMQTLAVSFQRYTPGMLLFPFVEPAVMRHYARTGDQSRLEAVLSMVIKIDLITIGATVVGTAVAGDAIVGLATGGRYRAEAYGLPWLLAYLAATSAYRAFEIVAVALNASSALTRTLSLSILWVAAAILLTPRFGLIVLLACPVLDSLSRLALIHGALAKLGVRKAVDLPVAAGVSVLMLMLAASGRMAATAMGGEDLVTLATGTVAGGLFLGLTALLKPFRRSETAVFSDALPRPAARLLSALSRA